ncbi:MAG: alpha/beta-type small acid-soluble spore protein [Firmicutes bacterium]|nr:alpha/beta-type small acid-soluble spore protein [Bacillota bacterium]
MARNRNAAAFPGAQQVLDKFKYEVANELGIGAQWANGDRGSLPSRVNGAVGGYMTKKMIEFAEAQMAQNPALTQQFSASAGQDHRQGATLSSQ